MERNSMQLKHICTTESTCHFIVHNHTINYYYYYGLYKHWMLPQPFRLLRTIHSCDQQRCSKTVTSTDVHCFNVLHKYISQRDPSHRRQEVTQFKPIPLCAFNYGAMQYLFQVSLCIICKYYMHNMCTYYRHNLIRAWWENRDSSPCYI